MSGGGWFGEKLLYAGCRGCDAGDGALVMGPRAANAVSCERADGSAAWGWPWSGSGIGWGWTWGWGCGWGGG